MQFGCHEIHENYVSYHVDNNTSKNTWHSGSVNVLYYFNLFTFLKNKVVKSKLKINSTYFDRNY
jgi:hypothetical protein